MSCSSMDGVIFQQRSDHRFKGYIGLKTFCILNEEKDLIYVQCIFFLVGLSLLMLVRVHQEDLEFI